MARVDLDLSDKAIKAIGKLSELHPEITKTDLINAAIISYAFFEKEMAKGNHIIVSDSDVTSGRVVDWSWG